MFQESSSIENEISIQTVERLEHLLYVKPSLSLIWRVNDDIGFSDPLDVAVRLFQAVSFDLLETGTKINHLVPQLNAMKKEREAIALEIQEIVDSLDLARVPFLIAYHVEGYNGIRQFGQQNLMSQSLEIIGSLLCARIEESVRS